MNPVPHLTLITLVAMALSTGACAPADVRPSDTDPRTVRLTPPSPEATTHTPAITAIRVPVYERAPDTDRFPTRVPGIKRARITLDVRDAEAAAVLRLIAERGGVNVVTGELSRRVTLKFDAVSLEDAFLATLRACDASFASVGEVLVVTEL